MTTFMTPSHNYGMSYHSTYPNGGGVSSISLDTPTSSNDASYLPTPTSGVPLNHVTNSFPYPLYTPATSPLPNHYSPSGGHHYSPSPSKQHQQHFSPSPHPYSPGSVSVAGPSTYRRTPASHSEQVIMDGIERDVRGMAVADEGDGRVGVDDPFGERSYSELKCLGDGSFGTVWLCDWHSSVRSGTLLSAMQCGAGARPEWAGKRLVALKRMKRVWEGGWKQAKTLGELLSLRRIPQHPAIIPLYDAFISPKSHELYFVFECMEGNLYQLTKSRRGRPLAAGLIASCFHQISSGLYHIHRHGYFHRDMKPENLLVTTTGLTDYLMAAALTQINQTRGTSRGTTSGSDVSLPHTPNGTEVQRYEKDVSVIVKLADFGLARATDSKPPYTEYVSTRWYRAPEVLLRSTEYGPPVDMWALGTILAEMLNLKPLFPGVSEIDQVYRICDTLGDPSAGYGVDERGRTIGGGSWNSGIKLAKNVGFSFPKRQPVHFRGLFVEKVPQSLVDCISDLLRYNPKYRMTSAQCIEHAYFHETLPHLQRTTPLPRIPFSQGQPAPGSAPRQPALDVTPRQLPPSHSHQDSRPAFANGDMRTLPPPVHTPDHLSRNFFPPPHHNGMHRLPDGASALVNQLRELDLPTEDLSSYGHRPPPSPVPSSVHEMGGDRTTGVQATPRVPEMVRRVSNAQSSLFDGSVFEGSGVASASNPSFSNFNLSVNNLHLVERQRSMPASSKVAAYVQEQQMQTYENVTPRISGQAQVPMPPPIEPTSGVASNKLAQTTTGKKKKWGLSSVFGNGDKSTTSLAPVDEGGHQASTSSLKRTQSGSHPPAIVAPVSDDPKKAKKEAERAARELEKAKREAAERAQRERSRAVMQKRERFEEELKATGTKSEVEYGRTSFNNTVPASQKPAPAIPLQHPAMSSASLHQQTGARDIKGYPAMPGSVSAQSVLSHESHRSGLSVYSGHSQSQPILSDAALEQQGRVYDAAGRRKARRRDEDDDHSMSSFDHNSLRSRSVLTIGTIDSDPGPRRGTRQELPESSHSLDPLKRRAPSVSSFKPSPSRLTSVSNPSLESQLAHDFMAHANLASGSQFTHVQAQASAPTSPYGHPVGMAVAHGGGMGRSGMMLPAIRSWDEEAEEEGGGGGGEGEINPMFRVPPAHAQGRDEHGSTTLPPFASIARVAGTHPYPQSHQR